MMITDHTEAGDELEKIAIKQRVTASDSVSTEHQNKIMALSSKLGLEFDGPYMHMMVNDHEDAVKLFTAATQNKNPDIQNFAKKVLPTLQMHLDSAKAIVASLK
jgi:putative membrane protein